MRTLALSLLACTLIGPAAAQAVPIPLNNPNRIPPEVAAQLEAQAQAMAANGGQPVPGQPSGGRRTPEQERTQMLQQLAIDRSASGILQARLKVSRPPEEPKAPVPPPKPPQDPNQQQPEIHGPPGPNELKQLEIKAKRDEYKQEVEAFRLNVILGEWDKVRSYLEALPENDAKLAYQRIVSQLGTKVNVNPRPELAAIGAKGHQQDQYLRPVEVLALSDAARTEPDRNTLKALAKLVPQDSPPPEAFFAIIENGTRYFGNKDLATRQRTAEFLVNANLLDQSAKYLPDPDEARKEKNVAALNLIARYHAEAHKADKGKTHLPLAWSISLELIGDKDAPLNERGEALYRALGLVPELEDESGKAWLEKTFTDPGGEGFEIMAAVGTLSSQSRQIRNETLRLEQLKLQSAAAKALLGTEGADLTAWSEILTIYTLNWIHEANYSYQRDQNTSIRPNMQIDSFGNIYYAQERINYQGLGTSPIAAADLMDCNPTDAWLALVDEPVRLDCLAVTARLLLKVKEEEKAFPLLQQLAKARPKQVENLVREMISVWAANHNPNQQNRYRSSYYYFYGANQRAETIPLTRSKQERNLVELAKLVERVVALGLEESFEEELSDAFIQAHSQAEVWRVEALQSVFGKLETLDTKTLAALLRRMRSNLANLWPNPKIQEEAKTKRRDKELQQHILKGYAAARNVAQGALSLKPDDWRLQVQLASLIYEESNYLSSITPQSDHSTTKRQCLDALAAAAKTYAATLPLEDKKEESTEVFETWLFAALGSPDLAALKAHHQPVPSELPMIKAALEALPEECAERHLERFATTLNNRLANVSPDLKYRYLENALQVVGEHERLKSAADVYQYYKDLVTEIELVATIDGSDLLSPDQPFGLYVNLRHTQEIERESGGFQRYLQNQNNNSYSYNYGRPTEDYRDKFEKAARAVLEEHFEVLSLTFHESKVQSRSDPELGWRITPYAYFLLQPKGAKVDTIPPLKIDLDFLDTSGYVVLPVSSSAIPVSTVGEAKPRPVRDLQIAMTLDERSAEEEDALFLDIRANGLGLVPELHELLELPPAGFEIADTEDRSLQVEELDAATDDGAPKSTHEWRLKLAPAGTNSPTNFTFPNVLVATAEEEGLVRQRYDDVDLLVVGETVPLGQRVGSAIKSWHIIVGAVLLVLVIGLVLWLVLRRPTETGVIKHGPDLPGTLTPVTLLSFLERLRSYEGLSADKRTELESEIITLQDRFFGPQQTSSSADELQEIATRWKKAA